MKSISYKLKMLFNSIKVLKNWYLFPLVYFNVIKNNYVIFKTRDGFQIKIRTKSSDIQIFTEIWLENAYPVNLDSDDEVIIDIGSHIGIFFLYCIHKFKNCKIFSFEADKENYNISKDNIKLNNLTDANCKNLAVSSKLGYIKFYKNEDFSSHSIITPTNNFENIESTNLKEIFDENKIDKCNLLKLDCEGVEYEILLNTSNEIYKKINQIFLEYHIDNNEELLEKLIIKLKENNYQIKNSRNNKYLGFIFAKKI